MLWRFLARPLLFRLPPESVHHWSMSLFHGAMFPPLSSLTRWFTHVSNPALATRIWDIDFRNPVGLAAGFDKQAIWFNSLRNLGFSHIEVGTITGQAQPGNPQPRLFRLARDRALVNRMGFNNPGADAVARQLRRRNIQCPIGINIGKTKVVELQHATSDYLHSLETLYPFARYFTVNVSSPNTPGLRSLQQREPLVELLTQLQKRNAELAESDSQPRKPLLLKIAPDMGDEQITEIAEIASQTAIDGLIATNTTVSRDHLNSPACEIQEIGDGGLSGAPLTRRSREVVGQLYRATRGKIPIVGAGGIMNGDDAWQMICQGASLIHVYTGFVYGGPLFVKTINQYLASRLQEAGWTSISQAVGSDVPASERDPD